MSLNLASISNCSCWHLPIFSIIERLSNLDNPIARASLLIFLLLKNDLNQPVLASSASLRQFSTGTLETFSLVRPCDISSIAASNSTLSFAISRITSIRPFAPLSMAYEISCLLAVTARSCNPSISLRLLRVIDVFSREKFESRTDNGFSISLLLFCHLSIALSSRDCQTLDHSVAVTGANACIFTSLTSENAKASCSINSLALFKSFSDEIGAASISGCQFTFTINESRFKAIAEMASLAVKPNFDLACNART